MNVTGSPADLAVWLVGEGRNTTFPVPEHGTVMLVGIFFGTKTLVKPARMVVVELGASAAVIFFPALPVYPTSKVEVGCAVFTSIFWPAAGWPVLTSPGQITVITALLLGTREIMLIHHTDCGMLTFTDDAFKRSIQDDTGIKPTWGAESFPDLDEDVRRRSPGSRPARSCRTPTPSVASSSTSPPASSTRSADR
jgi:hypothetical protein